MSPDGWISAAITLATLATLWRTQLGPDLVFGAALIALVLTDVLSIDAALAGFANPGVVTIGVLYVVVAGLKDAGGVHWLGRRLFGRARALRAATWRLTAPVAAISAVLNNTPVVAMLIPAVRDGGRTSGLPPSKLLIPLSYAAMLGGTCTLIGTSTNLVVDGLMRERGLAGLGILELAWVGVPTAIVGIAFLVLAGPRLLPDRRGVNQTLDDPREYVVEMTVDAQGPPVGVSVEAAGLRHLNGLFLVEIDREGDLLPAVGPDERLRADDRLVFAGVVDSVVDLQRIRGLVPARDQVFKLDGERHRRVLIEAVVSDASPVLSRTIRESRFRNRYDAVVIAVARAGRRLTQKLGDVRLQAGDTLLLEARPAFAERMRHARDFYLVSQVQDSAPVRFDRAVVAVGILLAMVAVAALGWLSMLEAALAAAGAMLLTRALRPETARAAIDWTVLITIGAAFALGAAMSSSGLAAAVAEPLLLAAGASTTGALLAVYLTTAAFSAVITNNAAAVLALPIALEVASAFGASPVPFAVTVMMAASASFATPIGYQTNLMVYGPGGYRFGDFVRIGVPMTVVTAAVALFVIPRVWPP